MTSTTKSTNDRNKRPRSPDHNAILEALTNLQSQLDDLPDVADEEMQLQLARLSWKLSRSPRDEPSPHFTNPIQKALYDLDLKPRGMLRPRTENMDALVERSCALGSKHVASSEAFNGFVASLRDNFLDSPRSARCCVEVYLHRLVGMFSESHPEHTLVIRPRYESSTEDLVVTPSRHTSIDIHVVSLCPENNTGGYRTLAHERLIPHFRGLLLISMYLIDVQRAIVELANFAKQSRIQTLRGVVTDGQQWRAILVTWDALFLSGHYSTGDIRASNSIEPPDFTVGVLHHWVSRFCNEMGEHDKEWFIV